MPYYVGILDGASDIWGVRIPDLPGCHGGGGTAEEAISDAASAAREWAEHRVAKGARLPDPRSVAQIIRDEGIDAAAGESAVMIPVVLDAGRTVRANLTLDAGLLEAIDVEAEKRGLSRSAFIASLARERLETV